MTEWAKRRLEDLFKDVEINLPAGDATVRITKINSIAGDAQITTARGKRKHIYDFTLDLQWEVSFNTYYI